MIRDDIFELISYAKSIGMTVQWAATELIDKKGRKAKNSG